MRTKNWVVAVLAVAAIASTQAYALTAHHRSTDSRAAVDTSSSGAGLGGVPQVETPDSLPQAIVAEIRPHTPVEVETVIVGFKNGLGAKVKEALVRAVGAVPTDTVPGPETIVATIDRTRLDSAVAELERHLLIDYVAVAEDVVTGDLTSAR